MAERKKKTFLTNSEKLRVLQEIKSGISRKEVQIKYNISERLCCTIVQYADEITAKANDLELKNKKRIKSIEKRKLEIALLKWCIQKRDSDQLISTAMLQEKALVYNEMLKAYPTFNVSC